MKKRMKTHRNPINRWHVHDATWYGVPASMASEAETDGFLHLGAAATYQAEVMPIRMESKIMKFLRSL